jgi:hypothetical protein
MRSVREDPRSVTTIRFEEGAQALMPRLLQSSRVRRIQRCSLSNGPCPCRRSIFPSLHIVCISVGCAEPVEYVVSVMPKSCCR